MDENIKQTPTEDFPIIPDEPGTPDPGVPEGTVLDTKGPTATSEVVVLDRDENGDVVGWHKEPA